MERGGEESWPLERGIVEESLGEQQSAPNINDVLQAIAVADPSFCGQAVESAREERALVAPGAMFGGTVHQSGAGGPAPQLQPLQPVRPVQQQQQEAMFIRIVEQPASKALRFRYECEGRSAGSIPGAHSTAENKTYPTIEIVGYRGRAVVVVSCVTKDKPYKPHPHNLVGKDLCRDGVCTMQVNSEGMTATFSNLGIQCVKKRDIEEALRVRESIRVDPFKTGFNHKHQPSGIDLNAVRLCFQVFLEQDGKFKVVLPPVVSDVIYDKKAMSELTICRLSHCAASVAGGQDVVLLCEKVAKEDISVNFFEQNSDGSVVWSADADGILVHKQVAIAFRTPKYRVMQVDSSIKAYIQLKRPSDGATSEPRPFELTPVHSDHILSRKRAKVLEFSPQEFNMGSVQGMFEPAVREQTPIKVEPRDAQQYGHCSPPHNMGSNLNVYRNVTLTPSPQYQVPTPSPPLHAYQYQPADFHGQQWNIPPVQEQAPALAAGRQLLSEPMQQPEMSWQGPSDPQLCLNSLLQMDNSLKQLNFSDLSGISATFLQPAPPMEQEGGADSFRFRTDNAPETNIDFSEPRNIL